MLINIAIDTTELIYIIINPTPQRPLLSISQACFCKNVLVKVPLYQRKIVPLGMSLQRIHTGFSVLVTFLLLTSALVSSAPKKKCLECYQCSTIQEVSPHCFTFHWHSLTHQKREQFIVGCNHKKCKFCLKRETFGKSVNVERGCINGTDSKGNELKEGCIESEFDDTLEKVCFCSQSLCNAGRSNEFKHFDLFSAVILLIVNSSLRY